MKIKLGIPLTLEEISTALGAQSRCDSTLYYITTDSRETSRGDLFISLRGERFDGDDFLECVRNSGAYTLSTRDDSDISVHDVKESLLTLAEFYLTKLVHLKYRIAITGSVGKTTTKEFVNAILSKQYVTHVSFGNHNNDIGCPLSILKAPPMTEVIILELGMNHRGEISRLSKMIKPDISVITNIGTSHIGNLGSREEIARAKAEISDGMVGGTVLCPHGEPLLEDIRYRRTLSVGCGGYYSLNIDSSTETGYSLSFNYNAGVINDISFNNKGKHLLWALGYALAVGIELGADKSLIKEACSGIGDEALRHRLIKCGDFTILDDCYNSSLESIEASIRMLQEISESYSLVLGDILECGDMTQQIHISLGRIAAKAKPNRIYYLGLNCELFKVGATSAGFPNELIYTEKDVERIADIAADIICTHRAGETILFKASRKIGLERIIKMILEAK